jgi:hypothetical protein
VNIQPACSVYKESSSSKPWHSRLGDHSVRRHNILVRDNAIKIIAAQSTSGTPVNNLLNSGHTRRVLFTQCSLM